VWLCGLAVASGHWTHPACHHREPQGAVQHRRRSHVTAGRGQQPSRRAAPSAVLQLRHPAAVGVRSRRLRCAAAARDLRVRHGRLRGGADEEKVARTAARVDVVEY